MENASKEINKNCPQMVDSVTRLDNTLVISGKIIYYNYTYINKDTFEINMDELKKNLYENILNNIKTNPNLKLYRENDVTFNYYYKDEYGNFLMEIEILPEQYK
jgi:hypothetical protein